MAPEKDTEFGTFRFDGNYSHPEGDVPFRYLGDLVNGGMNVMIGLRAGSAYTPIRHSHPHLIIILEGTGTLLLEGTEHLYKPGSVFDVPGNILHAFVRVESTTLAVERAPTQRARKGFNKITSPRL